MPAWTLPRPLPGPAPGGRFLTPCRLASPCGPAGDQTALGLGQGPTDSMLLRAGPEGLHTGLGEGRRERAPTAPAPSGSLSHAVCLASASHFCGCFSVLLFVTVTRKTQSGPGGAWAVPCVAELWGGGGWRGRGWAILKGEGFQEMRRSRPGQISQRQTPRSLHPEGMGWNQPLPTLKRSPQPNSLDSGLGGQRQAEPASGTGAAPSHAVGAPPRLSPNQTDLGPPA